MRLATLADGTRDGALVAVSEDLSRCVSARAIAPNLQSALDRWADCEARLARLCDDLDAGRVAGDEFDEMRARSPLPRAYQWCEASVFIVHLERCRRATKRELPASLYDEIGMYQGGSDGFLDPRQPIPLHDESWNLDYEAGVCVITDDVPTGVSEKEAARHIRLVLLTNDVSLRALQGPEMAKGLGVLQCKPASSFSPVAVTPDSLGMAWTGAMLARPVDSFLNGERIGAPFAHRDALFEFPALIAHLARTRDIAAGSIIGAGTVANRDESRGVSCLLEKRALEILSIGEARTPFLRAGDRVRIESRDADGRSLFGAIDQIVAAAP